MKYKKKSIVLIVPYFGKLPWYFHYYMYSCKFNSDVKICLITDDCSYDKIVPSNMEIVHMSFEQVTDVIKSKLQLDIQLANPYKLCDFKPSFGFVFTELIKGFDFWGMSDIDIIFGNIRNFITDNLLCNYDVITVRHDFLVGYFTLFRNCQKINELFMESRDYIKVFTSATHFCFDECNFAFWKMDVDITFEDVCHLCEIESMTHVVKRLHEQQKIRVYFNTHAIEGVAGKLAWEKGTLIFKSEYEIILYHMIILKKIYSRPPPKKEPGRFRISSTRIYH